MSLVELMVAMGIGLFLVGGAVTVLVDNKDQFLFEEEASYLQENARFAFDQLSYDLRLAGYFGCTSTIMDVTNTLNGSTDDDKGYFSSQGLKGYEYSERGDSDFPETGATDDIAALMLEDTDVVIINRGEFDDRLVVTSHQPASSKIGLSASNNLEKGKILVLATPSCRNAAIFQMSGPNSTNPDHIVHNTGASTSPGNCHKALSKTSKGESYSCDSPPANNQKGMEYPPGSSLMEFVSHTYFVGESDITGLPTLYRVQLEQSGSSTTPVINELISGVENMQLLYGVDLDEDADGVVDQYFNADDITYDIAVGANTLSWDRVMAVRLTLILRSQRFVFPENTEVDLGDDFEYNDRYMRQKVSATVRVRNRGLGVKL